MISAQKSRRPNDVARGIIVGMWIKGVSGVVILSGIVLLAATLPTGVASLTIWGGVAVSGVLCAALVSFAVRRVRKARRARLSELRRRLPDALIIDTEWNAALQPPFVKDGMLPARVDSRGFEVDLTAQGSGMSMWLGHADLPLLGELTWKQISSIERTTVHAAIGSHELPALRFHVVDSGIFQPVVELIYRGRDIDDLHTQLCALQQTGREDQAPEDAI